MVIFVVWEKKKNDHFNASAYSTEALLMAKSTTKTIKTQLKFILPIFVA